MLLIFAARRANIFFNSLLDHIMDERLGPIADTALSHEQRLSAQEIVDGPRGAVYGPFIALLRSPELMRHAQRMGAYLRYRSAIGTRLSELAILVTARHWNQAVEWAIHAPIAHAEGVDVGVIDAISQRQRPAQMRADEALVHDFCIALHHDQAIPDALYDAAVTLLGEQGVVDLLGINGYYAMLAMVMNTARTPVPPDTAWRLPP